MDDTMVNKDHFGIVDYVVFIAMLIISIIIGFYYLFTGGKQRTSGEYLLADGKMSILPVAFSLMASFMSAITLLGVSQENYSYGTQFMVVNLSYILATPICAYIYLPVFFRLQSPSVYSYLQKRFGVVTRIAASLAFTLQMIFYMGVVLYTPALALSAVTGLSFSGSMLSVGLICTLYSTLGGMKAVLMTDVFQSLLMFASILAVIICGRIRLGSFGEIFHRASMGGRISFFDMSLDPTKRHTFWSQAIGGIFIYCSLYGVNQTQVQRLLTIKDLRRSQLALWFQWPILAILSVSTGFAGLTIYAFYQGCDPLMNGDIIKADQILPFFVVQTMGNFPGLSGLLVAGIFAGSLSTVSSAINSLSAVTMEDYVKPCFRPNFLDNMAPTLLKLFALFYGLFFIGMAYMVEFLGPSVLQISLTIFGLVGGPSLGLFSLGMMFPWANGIGALTGFISSLILLFWISFGGGSKSPPLKLPLSIEMCNNTVSERLAASSTLITTSTMPPPMTEANNASEFVHQISYVWYSLIGFVVTVGVGCLVSLISEKLWKKIERRNDPKLYVSFVRRFLHSDNEITDKSAVTRLDSICTT